MGDPRRRGIVPWWLAAAAVQLACGGGTSPLEPPMAVARASGEVRPFDASSPFNQPIPPNPRLDPVAARAQMVNRATPFVSLYWYAVPILEVEGGSGGVVSVTCTAPWGRCELADEAGGVPIPAGARGAPGRDSHMVVWDRVAHVAYEFYGYRDPGNTGPEGTTKWGGVVSTAGNGVDRPGGRLGAGGATGSDISRLAGLIRVEEVRAGLIPHALIGPTSNSCASPEFRWPALKSDGKSRRPDCLPEGARLQLDPSIDLDTVSGMRPIDRMIAVALQRYGWYNVDNGGEFDGRRTSWGIQFELDPSAHGTKCAADGGNGDEPGAVYCAAGLMDEYDQLRGTLPDGSPLFSHMRVLASWDGS